jgi:DNA helicase-2/ATP-dependent DNA helicase PcrA
MDRYLQAEDRVFVLTVHQAKGLEFDTVFLAGATDEDFPSWHSQQQDDRLAEEHRLFYVAMTRPRRRLIITHTRQDARGRPRAASRFVSLIPPEFLRLLGPAPASPRGS